MRKPPFNTIGERYGMLTVVSYSTKTSKSGRIHKTAICACDCGGEKEVRYNSLRVGITKSCGCIIGKNNQTHASSKLKLYRVWRGMKNRCYNQNTASYKNYGARGIQVALEWKKDFLIFQKWCTEHGYKEGLSVERIDVNGNYEPSNCTLIPMADQAKNTRLTVRIEFNGQVKHIAEWGRILGVTPQTVQNRHEKGWPIDKPLPSARFKKGCNNRPRP